MPDEALYDFLSHCSTQIGDAYFRTPRNTIKAFIDILSILEQNPDLKWTELINETHIDKEYISDMPELIDKDSTSDDLTTFKI